MAAACNSAPTKKPKRQSGSYGSGVRLPPDRSPLPVPVSPHAAAPPSSPEVIADLDSVGQAAIALLSQGPFTTIVIEIDAVAGNEPFPEARALLSKRLREVTGKTVKVSVRSDLPARSAWDFNSILDIAEQRKSRSVAPVVRLYVASLNGFAQESKSALGRVVAATVIAVFPSTMREFTPPTVPLADVQAAVMIHEIGHLLGLVNILDESPRQREDAGSPYHSRNPKSVMYHAFDQAFGASVFGTPSTQFDADDLADLKALAAS